MPLRPVVALALLHAAALVFFARGSGPGFPLDDSWVHAVYARSLAGGDGFSYNPGQPETGVTAPTWTVLCAIPVGLAELTSTRPDLGMRLLGALFSLLGVVAGYRLASRAGRWTGVFAGLALALDPLSLNGALSGTEQPLFAWLTLLLIGAVMDNRVTRAGWLCGLLALTRPEGLLFTGLMGVLVVRRRWRPAEFAWPVVLCVGVWAGYCFWASGRFYPNTVAHKADLVTDPTAILATLGALFSGNGWGWALPLLLLIGAIALEGGSRGLGRFVLISGLMLVGGVLLSRPMPVVDGFLPYYWMRYALLGWPPLLVAVGAGLSSIVRTAYAGIFCRPAAAAILIAPFALVAYGASGLPAQAADSARRHAAECAQIEAQNVAAGLWINDNLPTPSVVATHDAGAVRYFGRRRVIDIWGNNHSELTAAILSGNEEASLDVLRRSRPDALVVFPTYWADYAAFLGLTRRAAVFHVDRPATVPDPVHSDLVIFLRP